jgi:peptidyl-prolyl cis-trans isomerase B (cyclophilin B)
MKRRVLVMMILFTCLVPLAASAAEKPRVMLQTTLGDITIELDPDKSPLTTKNFLGYVDDGFYDGTIFHRVIKGFMIQGGGLTEAMKDKPTKEPINNEADNGLKNEHGTIAMARTGYPHSATSQFFINTANNSFLNHRSKSAEEYGYCVFGKVVKGLDIVDAIENVQTTNRGGHQDVPMNPVVIKKAVRVKAEKASS